jgi:hypothetical protein
MPEEKRIKNINRISGKYMAPLSITVAQRRQYGKGGGFTLDEHLVRGREEIRKLRGVCE